MGARKDRQSEGGGMSSSNETAWHRGSNVRVMVVGSGTENRAMISFLLSEGVQMTPSALEFEAFPQIYELEPRQLPIPASDTYGPARKGKGGKVKRW
jgi:hypothetical protein